MKQYLLIIAVVLSFGKLYAHNNYEGNGDIVSTFTQDNGGISVYPNPAINNVFVEVKGDKKISFIVFYSLLGTPVLVKDVSTFSQKKIELNVSSLKKGKYIVKVLFSDGSSEVKSLIKQ